MSVSTSPETAAGTSSLPFIAALVAAVGGAATLAGAWFFQLVIGLAPCPLCLEQRLPYYIAVPLALGAAGLAWAGRNAQARVLLALVGTLLAFGAVLAAYHAGVEWKFWAGPATCSGAGPVQGGMGAGSLLSQLDAVRVVRCDEAPWRLLGLSLAGYNVLIAATLSLVAFAGTRPPRA